MCQSLHTLAIMQSLKLLLTSQKFMPSPSFVFLLVKSWFMHSNEFSFQFFHHISKYTDASICYICFCVCVFLIILFLQKSVLLINDLHRNMPWIKVFFHSHVTTSLFLTDFLKNILCQRPHTCFSFLCGSFLIGNTFPCALYAGTSGCMHAVCFLLPLKLFAFPEVSWLPPISAVKPIPAVTYATNVQLETSFMEIRSSYPKSPPPGSHKGTMAASTYHDKIRIRPAL